MDFGHLIVDHGLYPTVYGVCVVSGFVPAVNAEIFLLLVMSTVQGAQPLPIALAATCGQMTAKSTIYAAGLGVIRLSTARFKSRLEPVRNHMLHHRLGIFAIMFLSALTGLPPYYVVSFAAGLLKTPFPPFFLAGFLGRFLRFAAFAAFPELVRRLTA
jgi:membrane protein YqaA with SNARE-associated domain